jgi:hypothetical protein
MKGETKMQRYFLSAFLVFTLAVFGTSCRKKVGTKSSAKNGAFRQPPGGKAGELDQEALNLVWQVSSDKAPAAIRPDPDVYVRRILRQYRQEGSSIARQIGAVENYRLLLGGADEEFRNLPQETYDATSLLAAQKVAEEICEGLVAPNSWKHPGWGSILPNKVTDVAGNIRFLAQRFIGLPIGRIDTGILVSLETLTNAEASADGGLKYASYVPACTALSLDAEALLL